VKRSATAIALVECHEELIHFWVSDCPITLEQIAKAQSRDELMVLAKVVAYDYDDCSGLADDVLRSAGLQADVAQSLDDCKSDVDDLFPCRFCGGHVDSGVCDDCERGDGSRDAGPSLWHSEADDALNASRDTSRTAHLEPPARAEGLQC
jgi:hypothetical protein